MKFTAEEEKDVRAVLALIGAGKFPEAEKLAEETLPAHIETYLANVIIAARKELGI